MRMSRIMMPWAVATVACCLAVCSVASEAPPRVTLTATDTPVRSVLADMQAQTGVQIAVTNWTDARIDIAIDDLPLDEAVRLVGEAAEASWMRAYVIEQETPDEAYTAETLLAVLGDTRMAWFEGLSDEQRREIMMGWGGGRNRGGPAQDGRPPGDADGPPQALGDAPAQPGAQGAGPMGAGQQGPGGAPGEGPNRFGFGFGEQVQYPGGAIHRVVRPRPEGDVGPQAAEGGPGGPGRPGNPMQYDDPIRMLLLPVRSDTITLDISDVSVDEANGAFTAACGFLIMTDAEYEGQVTLALDDAELSEALDAIAAAAGAKWRPVYIVSQPRQLSDQEMAERTQQMEQRMEQAFQNRWAEFWQMPADERAQRIERMVQRMESIPQDRRQRFQRFGSRMLNRMTQYTTTLSPQQREELKPLLQSMARMLR